VKMILLVHIKVGNLI